MSFRRPQQNGATILSGPSADRPSRATSSALPSVAESPLEQDFTVPGTPSKLGCPFASMQNRRLSAHAASVVSRYKLNNGPTTPQSSVSQVNGVGRGRSSSSARKSIADPIAAETCAINSPLSPIKPPPDVEASVQGSTGVCPIRFLDQHSPEEVAQYFENHKHELPRSHEVCVKRYQSNEESIRQLDAKYGNLVSMIQGLGQKHVSLLPEKLAQDEEDEERESVEKVKRWANTVSGAADVVDGGDEHGREERQSHFDRPLKDIRLGESPSRPWGIQIPAEIQDKASAASSVAAAPSPALVNSPPPAAVNGTSPAKQNEARTVKPTRTFATKCPFGRDAKEPKRTAEAPSLPRQRPRPEEEPAGDNAPSQNAASPVFLVPENKPTPPEKNEGAPEGQAKPQMLFTGPVFIGYSVEQAIQILQATKM